MLSVTTASGFRLSISVSMRRALLRIAAMCSGVDRMVRTTEMRSCGAVVQRLEFHRLAHVPLLTELPQAASRSRHFAADAGLAELLHDGVAARCVAEPESVHQEQDALHAACRE